MLVLRPSVVVVIVAKRCVLEQKLGPTIDSRIWEIDWYQN